jgi:lysophospholipase L1-like esterase
MRNLRHLNQLWSLSAAIGLLVLGGVGCATTPPNTLGTHDSSRWEKDMARFEAMDRTNAPAPGAIVFVGSSSIRMWDSLAQDFPGLPVVNRGFGGSQLADAVNYADRIIIRYRPRQVIIYAGGNDINAKKDADLVFGDFVALAKKIKAGVPGVRIGFISSAPNPARWAQVDQVKRLNQRVAAYSARHGIDFINVFPLMLGPDGLPKPDIYLKDRLHMNEKGYAIWRDAVGKYLRKG